MSDKINEIKNTGLKVTLPRLKVLEIFHSKVQRHMSAEDVYRCLIGENSDIGLATVYRVLTQFEQAGILRRRNFESGKTLYELNEGEQHDHLVCVASGHVEEFNDPIIQKRIKEVAKERKWKLQDYSVIIYGVSPNEQKTKE